MNFTTVHLENDTLNEQDWLDWSHYVDGTFGLTLSKEAVLAFKVFLLELKEWNSKINLVSFHNDKEMLYRHFSDSLAGAKLIRELSFGRTVSIADIGTGAGFPGIPVYIGTSYHDITLIESITKKTVFLSHIKDNLRLSGLKIINDRVEKVARDNIHREAYDFIVSRAVSKLSPNLEIAIPLLKTGGYAILYKTDKSASDDELSLARNAMKLLSCEIASKFYYAIPNENRTYCAVAFKKISPTHHTYPRKAGIPEKIPL